MRRSLGIGHHRRQRDAEPVAQLASQPRVGLLSRRSTLAIMHGLPDSAASWSSDRPSASRPLPQTLRDPSLELRGIS